MPQWYFLITQCTQCTLQTPYNWDKQVASNVSPQIEDWPKSFDPLVFIASRLLHPTTPWAAAASSTSTGKANLASVRPHTCAVPVYLHCPAWRCLPIVQPWHPAPRILWIPGTSRPGLGPPQGSQHLAITERAAEHTG
jgi:hypothetical protein